MATNECIPYQEPGDRITAMVATGQSVVGGRFVDVSANKDDYPNVPGLSTGLSIKGGNIVCQPCAAGAKALGVAGFDQSAGKQFPVLGMGFIVPVVADGALTAGQEVEVGAAGKAKTFSMGIKVGKCVAGAADTGVALIKLY